MLAALAAPLMMAGTLTNGDAAERFGAREALWSVRVAPDGRSLLYLSAKGDRSTSVYVLSLDTLKAREVLVSAGSPEDLLWCDFAGSNRLVCKLSVEMEEVGLPYQSTRLISAKLDGTDIKLLGQRRSGDDARLRQFDGDVLDLLPAGDGRVLVARDYVPEVNQTGTILSRTADGLGVDLLDTATLKSQRVESPRSGAVDYISDGQGHVRVVALARSARESARGGDEIVYEYRPADGSGWRRLGRYDRASRDGLQPLAVDRERNAVYALKRLDGRLALYRVSLTAGQAEELVYANPQVDVDGVIRSANGTRVIGVTFADERRRAVYFDPAADKQVADLGRALPKLPIVDIVGSDLSGGRLVVHAASDDDPGRYYLFETGAGHLGELGSVRPRLADVPLSKVSAVRYPAADGTSIPAYLTLPPGATSATGLPGIVLPHGGPSARDEWGFDWLPQFLANRGYAVLQPNYRGSDGYGDAWFDKNGFRGWQTAIGDVTAGGRWLTTQGVPSDKLAIVGWSYGGYAALQSAATSPDLFRAVVAIAPVTDLQDLKEDARDYAGASRVAEFVGEGPHVRAGSPLRQVDRIAAPRVAGARHARPERQF